MKRVYLAFCALVGALVGANLATAERPVQHGAPAPGTVGAGEAVYCPLFPIGIFGDGTMMFYTELYDDDTLCLAPLSGWYVGDAPDWPYFCPACMLAGGHPAGGGGGAGAGGFEGLPEKVPADYRPKFPSESIGARVLGEQFVEFPVPGTQVRHRVKLLRIQARTGGDRKPVERIIGLGYEVEAVPASSPSLVIPAGQVSAVEGTSHGFRLESGGEKFLVFLAK